MGKLFLFFILGIIHFDIAFSCFASVGYDIYIKNNMTQKISVRCQSKDDDIGNHTLGFNNQLHWHFCSNFLDSTLFFCHFWRQQPHKEVILDVYNDTIYHECYGKHDDHDRCDWLVAEDGFYLWSDSKKRWFKKDNWRG